MRGFWTIVKICIALAFLAVISTEHPFDVSTFTGHSQKMTGLSEKSTITPMGTEDIDTEAEAAVLMDADTGNVLWERNAQEPLPPASMSKMMTMYLVLESLENGEFDLEDHVEISENAAGTGGASIYLRENSSMEVADLFQAMSLASANDAAVALAEHTAGSEDNFIERMNEKADEFGLSAHANFMNASGLPHENLEFESRMTARDTAIVGYHLLADYPNITELTEQPSFTLSYENQEWANTNALIASEDAEDVEMGAEQVELDVEFESEDLLAGVDGLKTGYTRMGGYSFIGTAEQQDQRLIAVVMRTDSAEERFKETQKILKAGFDFVNEESLMAGDPRE
ncbi:D-alanyl-D-alanine carboxypeptidase family protein [Natribacillus halophilus]|uniref:D-alanyl-D-alanine carboxypeptidase n=1 Tax=Natribacillus halophilus TaxID=549003 RepID=A0A1G8J646_9BACI|nr:D-alanyl-D-alanine carboxypeptidase family protein [Natribacillus halophilus]SDI26562.1 D-alanyl-D-alanine carboxypeptidase [Natribacillus halophilus]